MELGKEVIKSVQIMVDRKLNNYKADRTYQTVVKDITPKGYVVLDDAGGQRTVPCCIPNITLRIGQGVWVKEPLGRLNNLHICGVTGK